MNIASLINKPVKPSLLAPIISQERTKIYLGFSAKDLIQNEALKQFLDKRNYAIEGSFITFAANQ